LSAGCPAGWLRIASSIKIIVNARGQNDPSAADQKRFDPALFLNLIMLSRAHIVQHLLTYRALDGLAIVIAFLLTQMLGNCAASRRNGGQIVRCRSIA
jgi:hypothetical protein